MRLQGTLLYNISTGEAALQEVEQFLTSIESTGNEMRLNMINECSSEEDQLQAFVIKKTKIQNFTSIAKKARIKVGAKETEIRIQKDLFGQLLAISIENKIDIANVCIIDIISMFKDIINNLKVFCFIFSNFLFFQVLRFPLTPVPLSMCHIEGAIHKTDKAVLTKTLEASVPIHDEPEIVEIKVFDGYSLFDTMKQIPATFGNVSLKYLSHVCSGDV